MKLSRYFRQYIFKIMTVLQWRRHDVTDYVLKFSTLLYPFSTCKIKLPSLYYVQSVLIFCSFSMEFGLLTHMNPTVGMSNRRLSERGRSCRSIHHTVTTSIVVIVTIHTLGLMRFSFSRAIVKCVPALVDQFGERSCE